MPLKPTTKQLKNCLRIIGYYLHEDESVIKELLDPKNGLRKWFQPFTEELDENLIAIESKEGKIDFIKYCMYEFWELQGLFQDNRAILFEGMLSNYNVHFYTHEVAGVTRKLDEYECYVAESYNLFAILFTEIQLTCRKYNIDFLRLCNELNFDTSIIDFGDSEIGLSVTINKGLGVEGSKSIESPLTFSDIFTVKDWSKYVDALSETEPPVLDESRNFIGNPKGHKGVVTSWFFHLQNIGKIKQGLNRMQLSEVLNKEIKNLNLGKDGKSFYNTSKLYDADFEPQLLKRFPKQKQ